MLCLGARARTSPGGPTNIGKIGGVPTIAVLGFPGGARPGQGERLPAKREGGPLKYNLLFGRVEGHTRRSDS